MRVKFNPETTTALNTLRAELKKAQQIELAHKMHVPSQNRGTTQPAFTAASSKS